MTLEDVGPDNWRHCAALEVEESQRPFVAPVPYYLALCAYDEGPWRPIAVRVAAGWAFGALLQDVVAHDELALVDQPVWRFFLAHREAWLTLLLRGASGNAIRLAGVATANSLVSVVTSGRTDP